MLSAPVNDDARGFARGSARQLGDAERAAGITRGRLDPEVRERPLAQQPAVADAVERDAARQAQVRRAGACVGGARHPQHDLFAHHLHRAREIHLALRQPAFGLPRRRRRTAR
jgi:hypothetical protein